MKSYPQHLNTDLFSDCDINDYSIRPTVTRPARIRSIELAGDVIHIDMHQITDHQLLCIELKSEIPKEAVGFKSFRDFSSFDYEMFDADMRRLNWQQIFYIRDIDAKVDILSNHILYSFDKHAPYKRVRITKSKAPWLTRDLKELHKRRDKALLKFKNSKDPDDWEAYRLLRNRATAKARTEKSEYLNSISIFLEHNTLFDIHCSTSMMSFFPTETRHQYEALYANVL
nr:unnamed protein product [Callosobruchus analis]